MSYVKKLSLFIIVILAVFIAVNCASPAFAPEGFSILRKRQTPKPNCVGDYCPEPECVDDDATKCPCVTIKCSVIPTSTAESNFHMIEVAFPN
ncbi:14592_t:CDS:2 [Funneliformis geosporum]|uniref:14592_t:CDS:1 n=1 Tax=Funneliformis geosporum TaxID=1117311 RepID=A0A9W4SE31_9GLOM|nr:14592_t:CDS:2 [Funneliformis geosporum]